MSDKEEKPTIIVVKRIIKKGGHHGGSWKIAYADFVTAMMAFFMLMWMLSMLNKSQLQGISNYFKKPMKDLFIDNQVHNTNIPKVAAEHTENNELAPAKKDKDGHSLKKNTFIKRHIAKAEHEVGSIISKNNGESLKKSPGTEMNVGKSNKMLGEDKAPPPDNQQEKMELQQLKDHLISAMIADPEISAYQKHLDFQITDDGLKIVIKSLAYKPMFSTGKTDFQIYAAHIIKWLSMELNKTPKKITIIGHTDTQPYEGSTQYTNWELSTDRANAVRRELIKNGVDNDRIIRVQGSGSLNLLVRKDGAHPGNRRIEIIVLTDAATSRILNQ